MPTSLVTLIYSRSEKFQGLWNSVCGFDDGRCFMDIGQGRVAQMGRRGINGGNETWRKPCFMCPPQKSFFK